MGKDKKTTTKQTQTNTSSSGLDAASQGYVDQMRGTGMAAAGAAQQFGTQGLTPAQMQAMQQMGMPLGSVDFSQYQQNVNAPNLGLGQISPQQVAMQGGAQAYNPQSYQAYMDPYQQQVIGGVQQDFDRQRQAAQTSGAQQATAAGAFGGSRSGILQSQNIDNVNRNEANTLAQLRSGGYQSAQAQAQAQHAQQQGLGLAYGQAGLQAQMANQGAGLQAGALNQQGQLAQGQMGMQAALANQQANLGFGGLAAQQQAGLNAQGMQQAQGMYGMGEQERMIAQQQSMDPYTRQMMALQAQQGALGPYGQTNTSTMDGKTTNVEKGNLMGDILGVGTLAAGFLTGGATSGLMGMFGGGGGSQSGGALGAAGQSFFGGTPQFNFNGGGSGGYMPNFGLGDPYGGR